MRVLVTGSAGFIGRHVMSELSRDGIQVVGLDPGHRIERGVEGLGCVQGVIEEMPIESAWWRAFGAVVHLAAWGGVARAARDRRAVFNGNIAATSHLREALEFHGQKPRVIQMSSFSVHGNTFPVTATSPLAPLEPYGASKCGQELVWKGSSLPVTTLRASSVYGRNMRAADDPEATIFAKLSGWIATDQEVVLFEDGKQARDFVHIRDVIDTIRTALTDPFETLAEVIPVCSGEPTRLLQAVEVLGRVMKKRPRVSITGEKRPGDMRHNLGDPGRMIATIGRQPTTLLDGCVEAFGESFTYRMGE